MIPKDIEKITWVDIQNLLAIGRTEGDTIEFKSSFKGGSDFLALSDGQKDKAIEVLAKEVIAFLNSQGGDLVIGIEESANEFAKAESICKVQNIDVMPDRLSQSLSARIEPFQALLSITQVKESDGETAGVLVIRAPASLRAPHRSIKSKECYVRRGRESVPMPMDEIQDLSLRRLTKRGYLDASISKFFEELDDFEFDFQKIPTSRFHVRAVYAPYADTDLELDNDFLESLRNNRSSVKFGERELVLDTAFGQLLSSWKPILRGRRTSIFEHYEGEFSLSAKAIYRSGILVADYSTNRLYQPPMSASEGVPLPWLISFYASVIGSLQSLISKFPAAGQGIFRTALIVPDGCYLAHGEGGHTYMKQMISGQIDLPEFIIADGESLTEMLLQVQSDICALAGFDNQHQYVLSE